MLGRPLGRRSGRTDRGGRNERKDDGYGALHEGDYSPVPLPFRRTCRWAVPRAIIPARVRCWVIVGVLCLVAVCVGTAGASGDPYRDQIEKIPCPAGPPGWFNPPEGAGGRVILTPLTALTSADDPTTFFGSPVAQLDCAYRTSDGKFLDVFVRYALPIDLNPWNDFYIGCTVTHHPQNSATSAHPWSDTDRTYRVVGAKSWSLATFVDDLKELTPRDVARFEAITNDLLHAAQPYAHNCKLAGNGGAVDIKSIWTFSFDAQTKAAGVTTSGGTSGSFITTAEQSTAGVGTISNLQATDFSIKVSGKGRSGSLEVHIGRPIDFHHSYGSVLRAHVVVVASHEAGCAAGAAGTFKLTVQYLGRPSVSLRVCGRTFLAGQGRVIAQMKTV
jgi:hypothetical protein